MKNLSIAFLALSAILSSCASLPAAGTPEEVAARIVIALDEQRADDAGDLFARVSEREEYRQQMYPLLFEAAQGRYVRGDAAGSTAILSFMAEEYPDAEAVERALLYSLFLERSKQAAASEDLTARMGDSVRAVRAQSRPPVWVDLVETQVLIDQGRLSEALDVYERFVGAWDGQPEAIAVYVDDIERYLASH